MQFNTQEDQANSLHSTCSKAVTQSDELHNVRHPTRNPVISPSQVKIFIATAELNMGTS